MKKKRKEKKEKLKRLALTQIGCFFFWFRVYILKKKIHIVYKIAVVERIVGRRVNFLNTGNYFSVVLIE